MRTSIQDWNHQLRRMTSIYRSIPDSPNEKGQYDIDAFNEAQSLFQRFKKSWEKWIAEELPSPHGPGRSLPGRENVRQAVQRASSSLLGLFPTWHNLSTGKNEPAPWELKHKREKAIRGYQKAFREAFKALEEFEDLIGTYGHEVGGIGPAVPEQRFQFAGLQVLVEGHRQTAAWVDWESQLPRIRSVALKVNKAGLGKALRDVVIRIGERGGGAGLYVASKDELVLEPDWDGLTEETLIHELGHRFYFRELSSRTRSIWSRKINKLELSGDYRLTDYANENPEEAYAEAFVSYVLRRRLMGEGIRDLFVRVTLTSGSRRMLAYKLAKSFVEITHQVSR